MAGPSTGAPRSSKPQTATAIDTLDAAIWSSIIEFLPVHSESTIAVVNEAAATLQTLLSLRLVHKELTGLLHPTEGAALWQKLVLLTFDFSTSGRRWNIETYEEDEHARDSEEDAAEATLPAEGPADPRSVAMEGRREELPDDMLDEDFVLWDKLGIRHRPSQYGFLTTLQQDPPTGLWPSMEDPFTLFHDLVLLLRLPDGKLMETGGEGGDTMDKCLVAPASNGDPSSPFYRYHLMQTLGYAPHFWNSGSGIGDAWRGFADPNADATDLEQQQQQHEYRFWYVDNYNIPYVPMAHAKQLFKCIQHSYCDWRSVCCNSGSDGETPVFFVGKSKSQPHRWTGYSGAKTWT